MFKMIKFFISLLSITIILITCYYLYSNKYEYPERANSISILRNYSIYNKTSRENKTIYDFGYVMNINSCLVSHKILLMITSYAGHVELRSAHRRAFSNTLLDYVGIKRIFLLSKIPENDRQITQNALEDENNRFNDIVQGNFIESYRNLTLKHVMGLRWAYNHCPLTEFVVKLDDDIVFNLLGIMEYLKKYRDDDKTSFLLGYVMRGMIPIRNNQNKWYVPQSEYSKVLYPPFLSGWLYVTTPHTAARLVMEAFSFPYFWIDDVFVTGILASKLNIKHKDMKADDIYLEYYELMECCIDDMNKKNISCEFLVAPNGGHDNLLIKFQKSLEECSKKHCHSRSPEKPLKDTCVVSNKHIPKQKGKPLVHVMKL